MTYKNIFWLDDCPDVFGNLLSIGKKYGLRKELLLPRVTFAYDYEMGADVVKNKEFDLYILDGDFPYRSTDIQRKSIDDFLAIVDEKLTWADDPLPLCGEDPKTNNFASFYQAHLKNKSPVIVFSLSTMAPPIAFHLGLPFYGKAIPKEGIKESVEWHFSRDDNESYIQHYIPNKSFRKPKEFLEHWEYGDWKALIRKYLV